MDDGPKYAELVGEFRAALAALAGQEDSNIPAIDFYRACRAVEMMVASVCRDLGLGPDDRRRLSFGMMVSTLRENGVLPKAIAPHIYSIVQQRNMLAHSPMSHIKVKTGDFRAFLQSATTALNWYLTEYEGGPRLKPEEAASLLSEPDQPPSLGRAPRKAFLCYAKEDEAKVADLYERLRTRGHAPWMDKKDLLPGQEWEHEIRGAIQNADFFIACMSTTSVTKRGYVQKEIRFALDVLGEIPAGQIFLIPFAQQNLWPNSGSGRWPNV